VGGNETAMRAEVAAAPLRKAIEAQIEDMRALIDQMQQKAQQLDQASQLVVEEAMSTEQTSIMQLDAIAAAVLTAVELKKQQLKEQLETHREETMESLDRQQTALAQAKESSTEVLTLAEQALQEDDAWFIQAFPSIQLDNSDAEGLMSCTSSMIDAAQEGLITSTNTDIQESLDSYVAKIEGSEFDGFDLHSIDDAALHGSRPLNRQQATTDDSSCVVGDSSCVVGDSSSAAWEARCKRWRTKAYAAPEDPWNVDIIRNATGQPMQGRQRFRYDAPAMPLAVGTGSAGEYLHRSHIVNRVHASGSITKMDRHKWHNPSEPSRQATASSLRTF